MVTKNYTRKDNVTLTTIADEVGVSTATVSYVLNGHAKQKQISDLTVERILEAVERFNYMPNFVARNLVSKRTKIIGVLLGNLLQDSPDRQIMGMRSVFDEKGFTVFLSTHRLNPEIEQQELNTMLQHRVEAIICPPLPASIGMYKTILRYNIPLVFLSSRIVELPEVSYVSWDDRSAAETAVQHLIKAGCRRIAFIGREFPREDETQRYRAWFHLQRYEGYVQALHDAGLPVRNEWIKWVMFEELPDRAVEEILASDTECPDAILAGLDILALGAIVKFREMGVRIPEDISVIGMSERTEWGNRMAQLTTIREPHYEIGQEAARIALELIENPEKAPIQKLIESNELKIRNTMLVRDPDPS